MFSNRFTPTNARTGSNSDRTANEKLRADGGSPIARVFELTDADRISDLTWVEDSDGQLYALEVDQDSLPPVTAQAKEYISTAVAINIQNGTVHKVDTDEVAVGQLSRVDDALGGTQRLD